MTLPVMSWCSACPRVCAGLLRCRSLTLTAAGPRCLPSSHRSVPAARCFASSPCTMSQTPTSCTEGNNTPLKQWTLAVSPFSTVRVQLGCSISIRPLDPHAFPDANRAFVTVHGTSADQGLELDDFHVHYDDQSQELLITAEKVDSSVSVELAAPIKSSLFISTQGKGNVQVQKMECDVCKVQTEKGDCVLDSIKGHQVEVQTHGGRVTGVGTIHGNVDISTRGDSAVDVKKLQGTTMNVSTEHGPLKVKAIYAAFTSVSSRSGRIELGLVHGDASVRNISGDVIVDGSSGSLSVSTVSGDIDVYVGDGGRAALHSREGAVCVRVPASIRAGVELRGASVDISPGVSLHGAERDTTGGQTTVTGHMNGEPQADQWVKAQADRGSVRLKTQSWFESLKLG